MTPRTPSSGEVTRALDGWSRQEALIQLLTDLALGGLQRVLAAQPAGPEAALAAPPQAGTRLPGRSGRDHPVAGPAPPRGPLHPADLLRPVPEPLDIAAAPRRLQRRFLLRDLGETGPLARLLLAGALPAAWPLRLPGRLITAFDRLTGRRRSYAHALLGPEALGPALAQAALAPGFRMGAARQIRGHLRTRVLFGADQRPQPDLAAGSLAILALLGAGAKSRALALLATAGVELRMQPGWTGFWDCWLIDSIRLAGLDLPADCRGMPALASLAAAGMQGESTGLPRWSPLVTGQACGAGPTPLAPAGPADPGAGEAPETVLNPAADSPHPDLDWRRDRPVFWRDMVAQLSPREGG